MNQDQFVARRQQQWQQLAAILGEAQKQGAKRLGLEQVQLLGRLYRQTASDLAYARTYFPSTPTTAYLNQLVSQAHHMVYAEEPQRWRTFWRFFAYVVPGKIRESWRPILLAAGFLLLGGLVGFAAILYDPNLADALVPGQFRQIMPREGGADWPVAARSAIGAGIMLNNIRVGIMAFGLGFTLGIGTALSLFYNGLIVGALSAHYFRAGLSYPFWALILPHGVLELTAIFFCGAAGFALGWPIVSPGEQTRREALVAGARRAVVLVIGSLPFFVVAAVIEGFVTPMESLSDGGKYLVAVLTGVLAFAYILLPGRAKKQEVLA